MKASSMCIACMIGKQERRIRYFSDEKKKSEYMHQMLKLMYDHAGEESAPWLLEQLEEIYRDFWDQNEEYTQIKHFYNQRLLDREAEVEARVRNADDPVRECIKYVCAGNYIDFGALYDVNESTFEKIWEKAAQETVSAEEYEQFQADLAAAKNLVYLTDNCGEIVLDKIFMKHIQEAYPDLQITAIVRGKNVINDATMEDAEEVGLTEVVSCLGNGSGAAGTVLKSISKEAKTILQEADVIISKGQGNFESLYGEGLNPYYFFLCKCELFVRRFGLAQYESVFLREERMQLCSE